MCLENIEKFFQVKIEKIGEVVPPVPETPVIDLDRFDGNRIEQAILTGFNPLTVDGRYGNIPTDSNGSGLTIITQENTVHTQSSMQPRKKPDCSEDWGSESNNNTNKRNNGKDKLISPSFCYILAANFLLFFAFYLILPILPFYLQDQFDADKSMIGFILSCYTIAALCIRPFSGYLLDTIRQTAVVSLSLLRLHGHLRRIYDRQPAEHLYCAPYPARLRLRHGDSIGQYDRDRYPTLLPPWRGDRLLRVGK